MVKMNSESPNFPNFISLSHKEEAAFDLYSHLLAKRIIFLRGELTDETANEIIAQLLFLEHQFINPKSLGKKGQGGHGRQGRNYLAPPFSPLSSHSPLSYPSLEFMNTESVF